MKDLVMRRRGRAAAGRGRLSRRHHRPARAGGPRSQRPTSPPRAALTFYQMSGGGNPHSPLTSDMAAWCWGNNAPGALGTGDTIGPEVCVVVSSPFPCSTRAERPSSAGRQFRWISAGAGYTCAVTADFHPYCWDSTGFGELGIGSTLQPERHAARGVAGGHRFRQIEAGDRHTCV